MKVQNSMLSAKLFSQLEYICRKVRENDHYFGGIILVVGSGDFFKLRPVPDVLKKDTGEFCFNSKRIVNNLNCLPIQSSFKSSQYIIEARIPEKQLNH